MSCGNALKELDGLFSHSIVRRRKRTRIRNRAEASPTTRKPHIKTASIDQRMKLIYTWWALNSNSLTHRLDMSLYHIVG